MLVGNGVGQNFMNEQYFFVHKLGLGKEVVSLSLVVTEVSRAGGMR